MSAIASKRSINESLALSRRNDKADARRAAESARVAKCEARKAALMQYDSATDAWFNGGQIGPQPLNPRYYDRTLFPENFRTV